MIKNRLCMIPQSQRRTSINLLARTGRFLHALGNVKATQGVREESLAYHSRALSQYLSTIGKNHHRTGDIYVKVAEHYRLLRQPETALYVQLTNCDSFPVIINHIVRRYLNLALGIFAPRTNLKPEKARALYKRSLVLEDLNRLDDSTFDRKESARLYHDIVEGPKRRSQPLEEKDFDQIVAFWSR